jgi:hypothetical protein
MTRTTTDIGVTIVVSPDASAPGAMRLEITPTARSVAGDLGACRGTNAVDPVYSEMEAFRANPGAGTEVSIGTKSRGRLVAIGVVAVVVAVAVVAVLSDRSTPSGTGSTAATTAAPATGDKSASPPRNPSVCPDGSAASPESCLPVPSTSVGPAFGSAGPACLGLIQSAARAMGVDPDIYALVIADTAGPGRSVDNAIHAQLSQARQFLTSQHPNGETADPDLIASIDEFDAAMAAADAKPCTSPGAVVVEAPDDSR